MIAQSLRDAVACVGEIPITNNSGRPPWCVNKGYRAISTKDVISKEIIDFADWISLTTEEKNIRYIITNQLKSAAKINFPDIRIDYIGSTATETCLPLSDIDYTASDVNDSGFLYEFRNCLIDNNIIQNDAKIIPATVPIIKARSRRYNISIDIQAGKFEKESSAVNGLLSISRIQKYMETYPVIFPVLLLLKFYLFEQLKLDSTHDGGFSSTMLCTMLIFAIEVCPEPIRNNPADVLIGFMNIFGGLLNPIEKAIDIHDGGRLVSEYSFIKSVHFQFIDHQNRCNLIKHRADKHIHLLKACTAASAALRKPHKPGESVLMRFLSLAAVQNYERERARNVAIYRSMFGPRAPPQQQLRPKERAERWAALAEFTAAAVEHSRVRRMAAAPREEPNGQWIVDMWNRARSQRV